MFQIQLGNLSYSEALDIFAWDEVIAESESATKAYLMQHYIWEGGVWPPADGQWAPVNFHRTVPEPNAVILMLLGFGCLALRRKT